MIDYNQYTTELQEIYNSETDTNQKLSALRKTLERLTRELTGSETIQFPNLFARIVFISKKYKLSKQLEWQLQNLRVRAGEVRKNKELEISIAEYNIHEQAITNLLNFINKGEVNIDNTEVKEPKAETYKKEKSVRLHIVDIDRVNNHLKCVVESEPNQIVVVKYNVTNQNTEFNSSIDEFWEGAQINIIDYKVDDEGYLLPKIIVLEPDYLIDASAVAECFHDYCESPLHYFRNKFETLDNRSYILLGNLANFFLDELIFAENIDDVSFNDTFLKSFKMSPFEYTSCKDIEDNSDFIEFMTKAQAQFENIKRVIKEDFATRRIDVQRCTLEPSFFSEQYGFQGRLDLLHQDRDEFKIIELKSGKLPWPGHDMGKISLNHEVQTAIYRMMIQSVFGVDNRKIDAAILYSSGDLPGTNLRFAADFQQLTKQIINLRNQIVVNEHKLIKGNNEDVANMFINLYNTTAFAKPTARFYTEKIEHFQSIIKQCTATELAYFYRYIRFISRELYLQKIGDIDYESPTGVASLWNSSFSEREEALDVISDLTIEDIESSESDMNIRFARNVIDNNIVNFREGEICIVYPRETESDNVLNKQILKGSVSKISRDYIDIRFRHKQRNQSYFDNNKTWAIEHDTLDTSYNSMYKSLFNFLRASMQKRNILLGIDAPKQSSDYYDKLAYPENIINKAIAAEDYFLIVGPPGTGKTSIFAKRLVEEYHKRDNTNILILAYTNRAVDELCDAVNAAFGCEEETTDKFIRIGTELSCAEKYRGRLLQNIAEKAISRDSLRKEIQDTRIFISTIASINGRQELFNLKNFDVAIIDEASQILEPQIIGLLPRFEKFIMIGDHNQLPAIVLQKQFHSAISETELTNIGITNCSDSLFERLLRNAITNNWSHVHSQLTIQGRMHNDIAAFPSTYFYPDKLKPAKGWQSESWHSSFNGKDNLFSTIVASQRLAFFSTEKMAHTPILSNKINENEADVVVSIIKSLQEVYLHDNKSYNSDNIGIIAPYRNQIALIKHKLEQNNIKDHEDIMVDTVERFQGSQRDIIIISFCVNKAYQMNFLCNLNEEGTVDRKLNVSLTRARQQMFLIGNAQILKQHPIYATLLDFMKQSIVKVQ